MIIIAVGCAPSSHESAYYETLGLLVFSGYLLVQSVTMTLELRVSNLIPHLPFSPSSPTSFSQ